MKLFIYRKKKNFFEGDLKSLMRIAFYSPHNAIIYTNENKVFAIKNRVENKWNKY